MLALTFWQLRLTRLQPAFVSLLLPMALLPPPLRQRWGAALTAPLLPQPPQATCSSPWDAPAPPCAASAWAQAAAATAAAAAAAAALYQPLHLVDRLPPLLMAAAPLQLEHRQQARVHGPQPPQRAV